MKTYKLLSPSVFFLIIFCFILPFVSVSCGGSKITTVSGYGLAFGTKVDSGFGASERSSPDFNTLLIWSCAAAGFVFCFVSIKSQKLLKLALSIVGTILLIILMLRMTGDISKEGITFTVNFEFGIYAVFLLFIAAIIINYIDFKNTEGIIETYPLDIIEIPCPNCKTTNNSIDLFCKQCGSKLNIGDK